MPRTSSAVALLAGLLALAGCTSGGSSAPSSRPAPAHSSTQSSARASATSSSTTASRPASTPAKSGTPTPSASTAQRVLAAMSERDRVGQLLMVDCPSSGVSAATSAAITDEHVGSVILDGTSTAGSSAIAAITRQLQGLAPKPAGLFVAADQEGGEVQRLQGAGFQRIPSAVLQGLAAPATLRADARTWGRELHDAGVNVDLAPVLDTVPGDSRSNPPIGDLDREYGHTPTAVTSHGVAVVRGLAAAGVDATVKHFPGLGRVTANTDTATGVTDTVTTRDDAYLAPFRAAVQAHVPFVMISSAIYGRIDPSAPAVFSKTIITGMLRGDLGFRGVIISDDIGAAAQVSGYSVGQRAVDFVRAGGDIVLTVDASQAATMTDALLAEARSSASFRGKVDAAALRVLQAKQARGLL